MAVSCSPSPSCSRRKSGLDHERYRTLHAAIGRGASVASERSANRCASRVGRDHAAARPARRRHYSAADSQCRAVSRHRGAADARPPAVDRRRASRRPSRQAGRRAAAERRLGRYARPRASASRRYRRRDSALCDRARRQPSFGRARHAALSRARVPARLSLSRGADRRGRRGGSLFHRDRRPHASAEGTGARGHLALA